MAFPESLNLVSGTRKSVSPEILNPYLDWCLKELSEELNTLFLKLHQMHQSEEFLGPPKSTPAFRFSLQDLSTIADFGREGRPFRIYAFDDGSDSDEDDDTSEVLGKPWLLRRSEVPGGLMLELEHERLQRVQEEIRQRRSIFESSFEEEKMKATASIQKVIKEEESRKQMAHRLDQQYLRSIAEARDTHLSALQREHEQHSQVEERKLRKEAEALKKEILAREERERQEKLQAEAEAKRKAEALLAIENERRKQAAAASAAALKRPIPIVTQTAADLENMRLMNLESMRQISQSLQMNMNFKLMSQCETQVSKLPSFAFALAQVVVNVSSWIPEVMDIVLATMNDVCIFTVPKYFVYRKSQFESERAYFRKCGYNLCYPLCGNHTSWLTRNIYCLAAFFFTETDMGSNPHGLKEGWAWCARLLNHLPADRQTASALGAFLNVAGFRLCQVYNRSFMKLLDAIVTQFIVALKKQGDPDSNAVVSRLETYIATKQYLKEPNGRAMPRTDESTSLRY
ncbi:hypothetical protein KP509_01G084100 [Ceratopteris richardii]|uniref:mRNA export factor GLE1 n=1 Tax=Ceratopteris richardii TaxID=49495 RepID=A0A8T2VMJ2_CERRI|nr:hypothetical protein KP509_01G084100 [Ceratopteris richardii]